MTRNFVTDEVEVDSTSIGFPHLRNHVHLTNCIHLKNHMHGRSPGVSDRSLIRDLIALQKSRSLRDPSASPASWVSGKVHSGRRSVGVDGKREIGAGRLSVSSSVFNEFEGESREKEEEGRKIQKGNGKGVRGKMLSEQLEEAPSQTDNEIRRNLGEFRGRRDKRVENVVEEAEPEASGFGQRSGLKYRKKRRFRHQDGRHRELGKGYVRDGQGEDTEVDVGQAPRNGCGLPWNWSSIHNRGKTFLDIAGRSLSCGRSDPRIRKVEDAGRMAVASDHLTSSTGSDSEALPLLIEPPGFQVGNGDHFLVRDYSGELGIYANNRLSREVDSELESEARSGSRHKSKSRHRSLTQKYMPKTFKDMVGQNLVVQALSNAILRRKVGLIYVFYGPHGTGKTSCARVFAKALNCQSMKHPKPCDVCTSCNSHNLGKNQNVIEVGPVSAFDYETIMENVLDKAILSPLSSQYKVFIIDDSDTLPPDSWSVISKVIGRAPQQVVFILVSSSLDHFPHLIVSRCQKFFFPRLKDSNIISMLQWIATSEGLQIDRDALKLIASRSDGSLGDAEMTLDQLSLIGEKITLPLVQELVGLVSDEKLVDLLDLALSADTVNTVKSLREIMETGVDPLALMSQIATIITDILAGSYVFTREKLRKKFFRRLTLSKDDMEKLRQALKTLSEAEKQLRLSNDKLTWLTAALLQLAPDQQYMLPTSSQNTSLNHSPMVDNIGDLSIGTGRVNNYSKTTSGLEHGNNKMIRSYIHGQRNADISSETQMPLVEPTVNGGYNKFSRIHEDKEKIWRMVLENIQSDTLKQFLYEEGKLSLVSFGAAPTVQLIFSSPATKAKAEKFRGQILQAFEYTLRSEIILEIRSESNQQSLCLGLENLTKIFTAENFQGIGPSHTRRIHTDSLDTEKDEIMEIAMSPQEQVKIGLTNGTAKIKEKGLGNVWLDGVSSLHHGGNLVQSESKESEDQHRRQSLVRGKVSLAHVMQQANGSSQHSGWSRRKAVSIAEKLEQQNLRLEPRSRSLLCCRVSKVTRRKLPHLRIRTRKPRCLLKIITCGKYS